MVTTSDGSNLVLDPASLESLIVGGIATPVVASVPAPEGVAVAGGGPGGGANPILMLDQEQISKLENVLQSAEAKDMLGDVVFENDQPPPGFGDMLVDPEAATAPSAGMVGLVSEGSMKSETDEEV